MELIWVAWFVFGLISGVIISVVAERKSDDGNSNDGNASVRNRDRSSNIGSDTQMDPEGIGV